MAKRRSSKGAGILPWLIGAGAAWVMFGKPSSASAAGTAQASVAANPLSTMITSIFGPSTPAASVAPASSGLSLTGQGYLSQIQSAQAQGLTADQQTTTLQQILSTASSDPGVTSSDLVYLHSAAGV